MPVRAITFDADDTIWDFQTVAHIASQRIVDRVRDAGGSTTVERFLQIHATVKGEHPAGTSYALMRRTSIRRLVEEALGDHPALGDELGDAFFAIRDEEVRPFADVVPALDGIRTAFGDDVALGIVTNGNTTWEAMGIADRFEFWLAADQIGIRKPDPRIFRMAAAAAGCRPRELVHVGDEASSDVAGIQAVGGRAVLIDRRGVGREGTQPDAEIATLGELVDVVRAWNDAELDGHGVGPHPDPWPEDARLDPKLLAVGDRRNVVDRYRYWRREAIVEDLDRSRHPFHVAIENWDHDFNIGTVVRNANAFGAAAVHIVGRRRWNRRGAMVTDRYQHVHHHDDVSSLVEWAAHAGLPLIGVDNLPGSVPIETAELPRACVLVFGQEGTGLSEQIRPHLAGTLSITQFGSTRSINAGVASGLAMHAWIRRHAFGQD